MKPKPVCVEWVDSATHGTWVALSQSEYLRSACSCVSYGTIIHRDKDVIVIAGTVTVGDDGCIDQACALLTIPTRCVKKVRRL